VLSLKTLLGLGLGLLSIPHGKGKGKGKVVPVLFLMEHHAMKAYVGVEL